MRNILRHFRLTKHSIKERRFLAFADEAEPASTPEPKKEAPKETAENTTAMNALTEALRNQKNLPEISEIRTMLQTFIANDGQLLAQETAQIGDRIFRKFHNKVPEDVREYLAEAIPQTQQDMLQFLIARVAIISQLDFANLIRSAAAKNRPSAASQQVASAPRPGQQVRYAPRQTADVSEGNPEAQRLGNVPPARGLTRTRYQNGNMVRLVRQSLGSPWQIVSSSRVIPVTSRRSPSRRLVSSYGPSTRSRRLSALQTIARHHRMGPLSERYHRGRAIRREFGIPEGGYPSRSELAFGRHVDRAARRGNTVYSTGPNSVYIDKTGAYGKYVAGREYGYRYGPSIEPIPGYDTEDPFRNAYTGYRKNGGSYDRFVNSYYDQMGGTKYLRSQAKLRGKYEQKLYGEYPAMVEEFKSFAPQFRNHPRFGSSYRAWEGILNRYGGSFPDGYAYLTEFRTQIQAYRKAGEVASHMSKNAGEVLAQSKGQFRVPIPEGAAVDKYTVVRVNRLNSDGTTESFVYHPNVVEQFDASRDLEKMIEMGVSPEREYSLIGDRDGKKKLRGVNLSFAQEGNYTVEVIRDGYRKSYDVSIGTTDTQKSRAPKPPQPNPYPGRAPKPPQPRDVPPRPKPIASDPGRAPKPPQPNPYPGSAPKPPQPNPYPGSAPKPPQPRDVPPRPNPIPPESDPPPPLPSA